MWEKYGGLKVKTIKHYAYQKKRSVFCSKNLAWVLLEEGR